MIELLREKRLLFTICTGRCGTELLAQRLSQLPGVDAYHEPDPSFVEVVRLVREEPARAREFWIERKLPAMARSSAPIYAETTHLFGKGFLKPLIELGLVPDLILLSRPYREIALSLLRLNCVPDRTSAGRAFLISPDDPGVLPVADWRSLNDYQLCYWYCLETERLQQAGAAIVRSHGGRVVSTTLKAIRSASGMMRLIAELDLPRPGVLRRLAWSITALHKVNRKRRHKRPFESDRPIEELEREVIERIELAGSSDVIAA